MKGFRAWWNTRNLKPGHSLSEEQISELLQAIKFRDRWKRFFHSLWSILIGVCTIIAAVFSVLAYFK